MILIISGCVPMSASQNIHPDKPPAPILGKFGIDGRQVPLMVAHRCGAGLGPENTCGAVVQSSFYRPDFYEIDIRHTSDNIAVCFHDSSLNRTTNLEGEISGISWAELSRADAGLWFDEYFRHEHVPTFGQILECVNPSPLAIELKEPGITSDQCRNIADSLRAKNDISSVILSFHRSALDTYHSVDPDRRIFWLSTTFDDNLLEGSHDGVGLLYTECTVATVNLVHDSGKALWVWTVNENFESYIAMGVDAVVTDNPDRCREEMPPS